MVWLCGFIVVVYLCDVALWVYRGGISVGC